MKKYRLAIIGIFFDGYYDLWEDFLELFSRNWKNCSYPLYIINNEKELNFHKVYNVTVYHAGANAEYSRKVQKALQVIDADYYLILLEDFFFGKPLKGNILDEILNIMAENNIRYYRMQMPEFYSKSRKNKFRDKKYCYLNKINITEEYTVTCQPSIWENSFLKECIGTENYNAWVFEGIYSCSEMAHTEFFLRNCIVDYRNILGIRHGAVQGRLLPEVYKDFTSNGYCFKTKRDILSVEMYNIHLRKQRVKRYIPLWMQKIIKRKFHTNSVIEKHRVEIESVMKKMGIH